MTTIQHEYWEGSPVAFGTGFRVYKDRNGGRVNATCSLLTHQLGFELRLNVNGNLQRAQVCRSTDEVLALTEQWKAAMLAQGWTNTPVSERPSAPANA